MSTPLAVGQILEARAWVNDGNQASVNTFHYQVNVVGSPGATDLDVAVTLDAALAGLYKPFLNNNATYRGVTVQIIRPLPIKIDVISVGAPGAGTGGAIASAHQVSGLTSWYTATAGRKGRGRTFWPFPPTAFTSGDGTPTAGSVTIMDAIASAVFGYSTVVNGGRSATVQFGIYSRTLGTLTPVVTRITRGVWATQRKRGAYGRANVAPI